MSASISGIDIVLEAPSDAFDLRLLWYVVLNHWPQAVFQEANEDDVRDLAGVLAAGANGSPAEFFVYQDQASARSWNQEGLTIDNATRMLHFLIQQEANRPDFWQITLVIGALTREMLQLCGSLSSVVPLTPSRTKATGRRVDGRSRMKRELQSAGYRQTPAAFSDLVETVRKVLYPDWTQDELACHPHEALQFCEVVRLKAQAPVPDALIMKAMLNRRKRTRRKR